VLRRETELGGGAEFILRCGGASALACGSKEAGRIDLETQGFTLGYSLPPLAGLAGVRLPGGLFFCIVDLTQT
jgi:hypothetical protein